MFGVPPRPFQDLPPSHFPILFGHDVCGLLDVMTASETELRDWDMHQLECLLQLGDWQVSYFLNKGYFVAIFAVGKPRTAVITRGEPWRCTGVSTCRVYLLIV